MIAIEITQQIKDQNSREHAWVKNANVGDIIGRNAYPNVFWVTKKFDCSYMHKTTFHAVDGWRNVVQPQWDPATENKTNILIKVFNEDESLKEFTYQVNPKSQEEIDAYQLQLQEDQINGFMQQKEFDGAAYFDTLNKQVTVALSAMDREILFPILGEIDDILYPPLYKIKTGDYASALRLFLAQDPPVNEMVLNCWTEAKNYCQTYYDNEYPK